jgi:hypothetical protein
MIRVEGIKYRRWANCWRISNATVEAVVASAFGPRILHFSFAGGPNVFGFVKIRWGRWRMIGGHRFWHAPEDRVLTYVPDNEPLRVEKIAGGLRLIQPVEKGTRLQKILEIQMATRGSRARITHRLINRGGKTLKRAAWALSVMATGGIASIPLPKVLRRNKLLPNRRLALWPYTDPGDTRIGWKRDKVSISQTPGARPLKIGVANPGAWLTYDLGWCLFRKTALQQATAAYPDFNSTHEIYTNAKMLELETLGPLTELRPGRELAHVEQWELR